MTMLQRLRSRKTSKKIWIILAIVIIPAFCLWGFGSVLRGRKETVFVGKVFGKTISKQEFLRNYHAIRNQYLIRLGREQFTKLQKYLNLETQAWERIILLQDAKLKKIKVTDKEVVDNIKQYPFFQKNGKFIPALYQEVINYIFRLSPRAFEEETRDDLIIAKLYQKVTDNISLGEEEIRQEYIRQNEEISLDYICASVEDSLDNISVEEDEILDYYNKNSKEFTRPLSYNIEFVKVNNEDTELTEKISDLLTQGSSLQEAIRNTELEFKETGLFSINEPIPQIGWSTEILKILSRLEPKAKAWSKPVKIGADNLYFIALKDKKEPYVPPLDEVKDEVSLKLRQQKANKITQEKLNVFREEVKVSGFWKAAKKLDLKTGKTELFKRRSYVEGLGDSDIFFEAANNLQKEEISQTLNTTQGLCIVKIDQRREPNEAEFEEKREEFSNNLLEERKQEHFSQFLVELKKRPNTFLNSPSEDSP